MKHLVFDFDGVLDLCPLFTDILESDYHVSKAKTLPFFETTFHDCLIGKTDIKTILPVLIKSWGLSFSAEQLLAYWFASGNMPNQPLIDYLQLLRTDGVICSIATNQERYRTNFILQDMGFAKLFDNIYSSCDLGLTKPHLPFYAKVTKLLKSEPSDIIFFDDRPKYVEAAVDYGWQGHVYESVEQVKKIVSCALGR